MPAVASAARPTIDASPDRVVDRWRVEAATAWPGRVVVVAVGKDVDGSAVVCTASGVDGEPAPGRGVVFAVTAGAHARLPTPSPEPGRSAGWTFRAVFATVSTTYSQGPLLSAAVTTSSLPSSDQEISPPAGTKSAVVGTGTWRLDPSGATTTTS